MMLFYNANNFVGGIHVDVDGEIMKADDGKPYTTLAYANGPGGVFPALPDDAAEDVEAESPGPRPDLTDVDTTNIDFKQQ